MLAGFSFCCQAQSPTRAYRQEVSFALDNDVILFIDRYYSAGHHFSYRTLLPSKSSTARNQHLLSVNLGNAIFTSRKIRFANTMNMDRPYAGYYYGALSISRLTNHAVQSWDAEVGVVGEQTGISQLHTWWHEKTGFQEPRGWRWQIANEVVFNLNYRFQKAYLLAPHLDVVTSSTVSAGTASNKINQQVTFRFARFRPLSQSVFTNSTLAYTSNSTHTEAFFFIGGGADYVISNIFLEGSLFSNNPSQFTVDAATWVFRGQAGFMYSQKRNSFQVVMNGLTREMQRGTAHGYMRLAFARQL